MPFYVIAERDAHIVFAESQNPDWFVDDVYEFGKYNDYIFVLRIFFFWLHCTSLNLVFALNLEFFVFCWIKIQIGEHIALKKKIQFRVLE